MLPGWKWQVFPAEDNYYILTYGGVLGKKVHFCDQMVKKKRVKMSTGQCVESHGHLTKKMGGAFWVGHQSSKLQGFAPGGWERLKLWIDWHLNIIFIPFVERVTTYGSLKLKINLQ